MTKICACAAFLLLLVTVCVAADTATRKAQMPQITSNGRIVSGAKSIWQKPAYGDFVICIDNDAIGSMFEMFNFGKSDIRPVFFMNINQEQAGNRSSFTADVRDSTASDVKLGNYKLGLNLQEDGLVKIESLITLDDPAIQKNRYFVLDLPPYLKLSGQYTKDGKTIPFDEKAPATFAGDDLKGATISFFPDSNQKSFSIIPVSCSQIRIDGSRVTFLPGDDHRMSVLLDLHHQSAADGQVSELSPNGIDFWGVDNLHLPDYGASTNLIVNPSFEAGLRYWGFPIYVHDIIPLKYQTAFELDRTVAHTGASSLRIKAWPVRSPSSLGPFALPFLPGEKYTYSFYAKGSADKGLAVNVWGRGQASQLFPENVLTFPVTGQWQRFSIPFTAKERFSSIFFDAKSTDGSEDGRVWIDDVQVEKGDLTDFAQPPVAAELSSAARGNFLEFGQKPDFKLAVRSSPNAAGTVSLAVEDFFFKTLFEKTYPFKTDSAGASTIVLDDLSAQVLQSQLKGVVTVSATFKIDGTERPYKDYFRFSVMDFLDNTHKNKNLFNLTYVYSHQAGGPHYERSLERERAIGFGSICYDFIKFANDLDYGMDEERVKLAEKYGFDFMGRPVLKLHDGVGGEISERQGKITMQGIKNMTDPTEEELAIFEAICELKAKSRPWNKIWWFTGESNPGVMPLESHHDAFAKFLLATCRGIKRGNPDAQVLIEGGPWNMDPQYAGKWTERYIQDTRRLDPTVKFDGAAAHHYRNFPEQPDLDSDIGSFLAMLDRNGCGDWPFYVNEGGNYAPFNIPQEGMSPYIMHSANSWYIGPLSYHFGKAERITAAFSARNWLMGLKYADRVACMQDFDTPNRTTDYDFTSRPFEKIPNTLGRLLGNASFHKDIRFAPFTRCYVFKDDKTGSVIAAIWGHKESVDRWKEKPPLYGFDFGQQKLKFVDLMENEVSFPSGADGRTVIPISSFPFFIVGAPGSEDALCDAIAGATSADGAGADVLHVSVQPDADGKASVVLKNTVSKEFGGEVTVTLNGAQTKLSPKVPPLGEQREQVALTPAAAVFGKLQPFAFSWAVDGQESEAQSATYLLLKAGSTDLNTLKNDPAAWQTLPANELGSNASARFTLAGGNLVIAIDAPDQERAAEDVFAGVGFYVNPIGQTNDWALPRTAKQDLGVYELVKTAGGKLEAMCHFVQGTQAGSGSYLAAGQVQKRISVSTNSASGIASLVLCVPQEVMAPLVLRPGSRFGFNVSLPTPTEGLISLAPINEYQSVTEPGNLRLVLTVIGE